MLFAILEFTALLTGIVLPFMPLNRLYKKGNTARAPRPQAQPSFSDYAVDESGNLVAYQ